MTKPTSILLALTLGCAGAGCTSTKLAHQKGVDEGYALGSSDSIKRQYWLKQALERAAAHRDGEPTRTTYYTFQGPDETKDGRKLVPGPVSVPVKE